MDNLYWQINRKLRKVILGAIVGIRETIEMVWVVYGTHCFWAKDNRD